MQSVAAGYLYAIDVLDAILGRIVVHGHIHK